MARERILFVCTANLDRSPTAADLYHDDPRYEVASAGTAPYAQRPLTRQLVAWADRIFVMNEAHARLIRQRFGDLDRAVVDLEVPDHWIRGDPDLVRLLLTRTRAHLGEPQAGADER